MVDDSINISGPWDFEKFPIFPFHFGTGRFPRTWQIEVEKLIEQQFELNLHEIHIVSETEVCIGSTSGTRIVLPSEALEKFVKVRVRDMAKQRLDDLRKERDAEIVNLIAQNCHAALRRIASPRVPDKPSTINVQASDEDEYWMTQIRKGPQELGGSNGVPMSTFHRLHGRGKVYINSAGLVEADPKTRRRL